MLTNRKKYLWYTDIHLNRINPITLLRFISSINRERPDGVFITGDISSGTFINFHLELMAKRIECPVYFTLGNHDYWTSSFKKKNEEIGELCSKYSNLVWTSKTGMISLNEEVALAGVEGWYDAVHGDDRYLLTTLDWILVEEFRQLKDMHERISLFRSIAKESCEDAEKKLLSAFDSGHKSVYLLTHFPPWKEAVRAEGTPLEDFWLPYNVNAQLGATLETIMHDRNKKHLTVLTGHTHDPRYIRVSRNIDCQVGEGHALFKVRPQVIYL